jgi:hypothetical protein
LTKRQFLGSTAGPVGPKTPDDLRRGFRGVPPPLPYTLDALPDDALLTGYEAAALSRFSTITLDSWRQIPGHALKWEYAAGRYIRYRAGNLKAFLALPRAAKPERLDLIDRLEHPDRVGSESRPERGTHTSPKTTKPSRRGQVDGRALSPIAIGARPDHAATPEAE